MFKIYIQNIYSKIIHFIFFEFYPFVSSAVLLNIKKRKKTVSGIKKHVNKKKTLIGSVLYINLDIMSI